MEILSGVIWSILHLYMAQHFARSRIVRNLKTGLAAGQGRQRVVRPRHTHPFGQRVRESEEEEEDLSIGSPELFIILYSRGRAAYARAKGP